METPSKNQARTEEGTPTAGTEKTSQSLRKGKKGDSCVGGPVAGTEKVEGGPGKERG